jgi:hypothetical protein
MANGNSNISRRQFVGASGALLAGAAVAGTLTGQVVHAQQTALQGRIVALKKGPVTIHTYVAPEASVQVTSHIIETAKSLVIVDTQFLQSFGKEVRAYADSLKKPISQVILSHEHPDHWYGGNLYKDVPFTSTATVQKNIQAQIDSGAVAANVKTFGPEAPAEPFAPDGKLTPGVQTIDGVTLDIEAKPGSGRDHRARPVVQRPALLPRSGSQELADDSGKFPGAQGLRYSAGRAWSADELGSDRPRD